MPWSTPWRKWAVLPAWYMMRIYKWMIKWAVFQNAQIFPTKGWRKRCSSGMIVKMSDFPHAVNNKWKYQKNSLLFSVLNLVQGIHPFRFPIVRIVELCKDNTGLNPSLYLWMSTGYSCSLPNAQGYDLYSPCHSGSHILLDPVETGLLSFLLCNSWVTNALVPGSIGCGSALAGQLFSYKCFSWYPLKLQKKSYSSPQRHTKLTFLILYLIMPCPLSHSFHRLCWTANLLFAFMQYCNFFFFTKLSI